MSSPNSLRHTTQPPVSAWTPCIAELRLGGAEGECMRREEAGRPEALPTSGFRLAFWVFWQHGYLYPSNPKVIVGLPSVYSYAWTIAVVDSVVDSGHG